MVQVHPGHRFSKAHRLRRIQAGGLFLEVNVAIGTGAGTGRTHDQKGGGAVVEAFADIGARGFFTHRIQVQIPQNILNGADTLPLGCFNP